MIDAADEQDLVQMLAYSLRFTRRCGIMDSPAGEEMCIPSSTLGLGAGGLAREKVTRPEGSCL
jgi:hypothetical protein